MLDKLKNTKKHLQTQIREAERVQSDWVYIRKKEAEMCLQLAEAEDVILEMLEENQNGTEA